MEIEDISLFKKDALHREVQRLKDEIRLMEMKKPLNKIETENVELKNKVRQLQSHLYMKVFGMEEQAPKSPIEKPVKPEEKLQVVPNGDPVKFNVDVIKLESELAYYKELSADCKNPVNIKFDKMTEFTFKNEYLKVKSDYDALLKLYNEKPKYPLKALEIKWEEKELSSINADLNRIRNTRDLFKTQIDEYKAKNQFLVDENKRKDNDLSELKESYNSVSNQFILSQMQLNASDVALFEYWSKQQSQLNLDKMDLDDPSPTVNKCAHDQWILELKAMKITPSSVAKSVPELIQKYSALALINKELQMELMNTHRKCNSLETATSQLYNELIKLQSNEQENSQKIAKMQGKVIQANKQRDQLKNAMIASDAKNKELGAVNKEMQDKTALLQELIDELQKLNKELESKQRPSQIVQQHIVDGYKKEIDELNIKLIDARDNFQNGKNQIVGLSKHVSKLQADLKAHQKRILTIKNNIEQCGGDFGKLEQIQGKEAVDTMEQYKTLLKCSACNLNFKSHIITRCWHMFCENCIQSRIETRQRKCPTCSDGFGINEVKPIYF